MKKGIFIILSYLLLAICASASEVQDEIISSIENDLDAFESSLPEYVKEFLPKEIFSGDFSSLINGDINQMSFLDYIVNYLFSCLPIILKSFSGLLALMLVVSIFNTMKASFVSEGLKNAFSMCSTLCVSISVFSSVNLVIDLCVDYIGALCGAMNTFAPIMSALYIMTGAISSASVSNASMMLFLSIVQNFIAISLVPIIKICLCFSIVSSISCGVDLSGISRLIKNTFTWVCAFLISIFSFVMSFQSVLSQGVDTLSLRTARFAIGNFIPIVGGFLGDSLKTISSSISFIKSSCGVVAIIVIVIITLPVIISLLLYRLSFSLLSGVSRALGNNSECSVLDEASTLCSFILSIVVLMALIFVFALTIFIKSSVG